MHLPNLNFRKNWIILLENLANAKHRLPFIPEVARNVKLYLLEVSWRGWRLDFTLLYTSGIAKVARWPTLFYRRCMRFAPKRVVV